MSSIVNRALFVPVLAPRAAKRELKTPGDGPSRPWILGREVLLQPPGGGRPIRTVMTIPARMLDDSDRQWADMHAPQLLTEARFEDSDSCAACCDIRNTKPIQEWAQLEIAAVHGLPVDQADRN